MAARSAERVDLAHARLRDAGVTALIAFGLFLPLIGFQTVVDFRNESGADRRAGRCCSRSSPSSASRRLAFRSRSSRGSSSARCGRARPPHRRGASDRANGSCPFAIGFVIVYPLLVIVAQRLRRRGEMDRQFRHPDPDLRDARLGAEHRGRPRRPARPRLCRLLRGRRLFLRAARQDLRLLVLDPAAAGRHPRRRSGASCSAFRCCGCAATISPSSRWPSARSSASC